MDENQNTKKDFRELLKDVVYHKDVLEDHIGNALEAAGDSKEQLMKLNGVINKMEKLFDGLKKDIQKQISDVESVGQVRPVTPEFWQFERLSSVASSANDNTNEHCMVADPVPERLILVPEKSVGPKIVEHNKTIKGPRVRSRNDYPVEQRVFIPSMSMTTTQKDIFDRFKTFGRILDVSLFPPKTANAKAHSGCVVYDSPDSAKKAIGAKFELHGVTLIGTEFRSKEDLQKKGEAKASAPQFQVYLRGIPPNASHNEVYITLNALAKVKTLRLRRGEPGTLHSGIGWVAFQSEEDAQRILQTRLIHIFGKQVTCEVNTRSNASILAEPQSLPETLSKNAPSPVQFLRTPMLNGAPLMSYPMSVGENVNLRPVDGQPFLQTMGHRQPILSYPIASNTSSIPNNMNTMTPTTTSSGGNLVANGTNGNNEKSLNASNLNADIVGNASASGQLEITPMLKDKCGMCQVNPLDCVLLWCGHDSEVCMTCGYDLMKNSKQCPKSGCGAFVEKIQYLDVK